MANRCDPLIQIEIPPQIGRRLARNSKDIGDEVMSRITAFLTPEQVVTLTAFGAMMVATNIFINALDVDLDEYLFAYRKA